MALLVVIAALSLAAAWLAAAILLPLWGQLLAVSPRFARWTPLACAIPLLVGGLLAVATLLPGDPHLEQALGCHCATSMPGWLHLCPMHPHHAAALLPAAGVLLALLLPGRLRQLIALRREPLGDGGDPVVTGLSQPTALVVGWLRPTVVIDQQLWEGLTPAERAAVLAHEQGHLARRDPLLLMAQRLMASVGPQAAGRSALRGWLRHAERQADAAAARAVGDPLVVAEALLRCARLGRAATPALSWHGGQVEARVHALLSGDPTGARTLPDVRVWDLVLLAVLCLAGLAALPWLHHQIEHLLNLSL